jgi:spore germination cell wall hydrolase CwlJ-like protein
MKTLTAILLLISLQSYADESELCLTQALYFEARNQGVQGMAAVAEVVMSRVESVKYPSTVCQVMRQGVQYSFYSDGKSDYPDRNNPVEMAAWGVAKSMALAFLGGAVYEPLEGYTVYARCDVPPTVTLWDYSVLSPRKPILEHCFYLEYRVIGYP